MGGKIFQKGDIKMVGFYGSLCGTLLVGVVGMYVFGHPIPGIILAIISTYFFAESYRWAYWKKLYYNKSDGVAINPPPKSLIILLIRRK